MTIILINGYPMTIILINGYPMTIINRQCQKVVNIHRAKLLKYKEIIPTGRLLIIHTYHPSVMRMNKTIIKEFNDHRILTSSKHPFVITPICAYRQPSNLKKHSHKMKIFTYCNIYRQLNYNCDSSNIVYLVICKKCNYGNYVDETSTKYRLRMNNHRKALETTTMVCRWLYITIIRSIPPMTFRMLYCGILCYV